MLIIIFHFHQFRSSSLHEEATSVRNYTQQNTWQLQKVLGIVLFLRNTKEHHYLSYAFFKIALFCNCALLPATVKALETFLEAILWKPFQLLRRILSDISRITTAPTLQCRFLLRAGENQLKPGQKIIVDAPVLSHCSLLRNLWQKPTGVLEHCRERETVCSPFFGTLLLTPTLVRQRMSMCS